MYFQYKLSEIYFQFVEKLLRDVLSVSYKLDDPTYTMVFYCYCRKGHVKIGVKLLKEMEIGGCVRRGGKTDRGSRGSPASRLKIAGWVEILCSPSA